MDHYAKPSTSVHNVELVSRKVATMQNCYSEYPELIEDNYAYIPDDNNVTGNYAGSVYSTPGEAGTDDNLKKPSTKSNLILMVAIGLLLVFILAVVVSELIFLAHHGNQLTDLENRIEDLESDKEGSSSSGSTGSQPTTTPGVSLNEFDELKNNLSALRNDLTDLQNRLDGVSSNISSIHGGMDNFQIEMSNLTVGLTDILSTVQHLETRIIDLESVIDTLEGITEVGLLEALNITNAEYYVTDEGFLIFQQRMSSSMSFDRVFTEYKEGFGDTPDAGNSATASFWLGLDRLNSLTSENSWKLRVEVWDSSLIKKTAEYSGFSIGPSPDYTFNINSKIISEFGDDLLLTETNGESFDATDNDQSPFTCSSSSNRYGGGWWFPSSGGCSDICLNAKMCTNTWCAKTDADQYVAKTRMMMKLV